MQEKLMIESSDISRILGMVGSPLIVISELIKNSVDADAKKIEVRYDQEACQIQVVDNGNGITIDEIKNLAKPGFSTKKINGNIRNKNGFYFSGNKGLGILSTFSICEEIEINTYTEVEGRYFVKLNKAGVMDYEKVERVEELPMVGTSIALKGITSEYMNFLTTSTELQKLRHISPYLYKHKELCFPEISLIINDDLPTPIFLNAEIKGMTYDVSFDYDKKSEKLNFRCYAPNNENINDSVVEFSKYDIKSLERVLLEKFGIEKTIKTRTNDMVDYQLFNQVNDVPSFEGRMVVYSGKNADSTLKQYGAGVNVYVNQFAVYNYLSQENDWLGLADFSQRKKVTKLRPHNVFGYVNFNEFNENEEKLRISNERADFIQDQTFAKLMYLIKGVVMFTILNIDVAEKNPKYKVVREENKEKNLVSESKSPNVDETVATLSEIPLKNKISNQGNKEKCEIESKKGSQTKSVVGSHSDVTTRGSDKDNQVVDIDVYKPVDIYKPKRTIGKEISFTRADGVVIEKLKNKDDLSNKIYHLVYEIANLNIQNYYCSMSALYRSLLECSTRYAINNLSDKLVFKEDNLQTNVLNVINYYSNMTQFSKSEKKYLDKEIKGWRDTITNRNLIDKLNHYMHTGANVDTNFLEQTWRTMKSYIIKCISE